MAIGHSLPRRTTAPDRPRSRDTLDQIDKHSSVILVLNRPFEFVQIWKQIQQSILTVWKVMLLSIQLLEQLTHAHEGGDEGVDEGRTYSNNAWMIGTVCGIPYPGYSIRQNKFPRQARTHVRAHVLSCV